MPIVNYYPTDKWVKNLFAMQETQKIHVLPLGWEDSLGEEIATHSSILVWEIPWIEEPGGLLSMRSQSVGHHLVTEHACTLEKAVL